MMSLNTLCFWLRLFGARFVFRSMMFFCEWNFPTSEAVTSSPTLQFRGHSSCQRPNLTNTHLGVDRRHLLSNLQQNTRVCWMWRRALVRAEIKSKSFSIGYRNVLAWNPVRGENVKSPSNTCKNFVMVKIPPVPVFLRCLVSFDRQSKTNGYWVYPRGRTFGFSAWKSIETKARCQGISQLRFSWAGWTWLTGFRKKKSVWRVLRVRTDNLVVTVLRELKDDGSTADSSQSFGQKSRVWWVFHVVTGEVS